MIARVTLVGDVRPADVFAPPTEGRCGVCNGALYWIDCPSGGWWKHYAHPSDDHDAEPMHVGLYDGCARCGESCDGGRSHPEDET